MGFGEVLAQLRRQRAADLRRDISPADVARHMGISRAAYSHWEKNRSRPKDVGTYRRLAAFMGVPLSELGVNVDEMATGLPIEQGVDKPLGAARKPQKRKRGEG